MIFFVACFELASISSIFFIEGLIWCILINEIKVNLTFFVKCNQLHERIRWNGLRDNIILSKSFLFLDLMMDQWDSPILCLFLHQSKIGSSSLVLSRPLPTTSYSEGLSISHICYFPLSFKAFSICCSTNSSLKIINLQIYKFTQRSWDKSICENESHLELAANNQPYLVNPAHLLGPWWTIKLKSSWMDWIVHWTSRLPQFNHLQRKIEIGKWKIFWFQMIWHLLILFVWAKVEKSIEKLNSFPNILRRFSPIQEYFKW